ncbi:tRNA (N6-isopentenyl adenosine(37)-C2)-methylthiotransferase MiaB [Cellulomonas sp. H30R-01]|uniref:tRNA (N6-isopentenyl adenosine(37)-C2)-methylthiotransferase MiaB n=1 Tax=Cellulomonas sp. H30R-01 TaxID=2704467 RepID=UPI00138B2A4F|nr:tRNA (N6-isopentenyl adenosine(37)-C2)-methylthiotransferase MiaB [Cellulomonas sp. H30R-01]QHT55451.1 tRNA (N6-isopentenyl adenosine(37)-C2)-methylthiotransferase MiaB [Cellulomonas sp. H30R-01]
MSTTLPAPTPLDPEVTGASPRTYLVKTLGCQMNVHDSEHMAGMLEQAGYVPATPEDAASEDADVIVINTCAVRENAADKLYGNLGRLAGTKRARPGMQIAVGGCLAQKDRAGIVERAPWVDVVFGTHNLDVLPVLLERARHNERAEVEIAESLQVFPSTLPTRRESAYAGWVSISVGCNNTCTFCIVPHLRGKERDRRPGEILAEVEALVQQGAIEVTLLGQNVNSYGVEFGDRGAFAKLLRAAGAVEGLERLRFTSPHPAAFTDDVIEAMAATPTVMPQLHMPLQSGSDRVLRAMRRSYRSEKFLGILDRVRAAMPHAAITTDIIVGFPGETEEDFADTLRVVEASRFASAFTFQYSPRPGTPAADLPDQLPKAVVQERYERLVALQERISLEENEAQVGRTLDVLMAEGEGRKDGATERRSGRAEDNRLVHLALPAGLAPQDAPRPGDVVTVTVTHGAPHHLVADSAATGGTFAVRRTRAGDAWEARQAGGDAHDHGGAGAACGTGAPAPTGPVVLGLPTIGVRA